MTRQFPETIATRSLLCQGRTITVEIGELGQAVSIPANGGQYIGAFCGFRMQNGPFDYVAIGINLAVFTGLTDGEKRLLEGWVPRAGLLALIDVLCGRATPQAKNFIFLPPPDDLSVDPQKNDMTFFRQRSRHDVLRVLHDHLSQPTGNLRITVDEILASTLLTRLYFAEDIHRALMFWQRSNFVSELAPKNTALISETDDVAIAGIVESYDWEEDTQARPKPVGNTRQSAKKDVFICHSSEDKDAFVRPLAKALTERGVRVWYDEYTLKLGDRLRREIDIGLSSCRFGIVVLSPGFFAKEWPQYELDGLAEREADGKKVILPIWHDVSHDDVLKYSPSLANRVAVKSVRPMNEIVASILDVISS